MRLFELNDKTVNGALKELYRVVQYSEAQEEYMRQILEEVFIQGMYKERNNKA